MPRPFGTDRLELAPAGRVALVCRQQKGWTPRKGAERGMALHPGTTVQWDGDLWEVLEAGETAAGDVRYELGPWDERHVIRVLLPYNERSEIERTADARDQGRRRAGRGLALLLAPVAWLLPGRVQERLEVELSLR